MIILNKSVKKAFNTVLLSLLIINITLTFSSITANNILEINDSSLDNKLTNTNRISGISSATSINLSTEPLNPTTVSVDVYYSTSQPTSADCYIQVDFSAGEVYYIWAGGFHGQTFSLYEDSSFSSDLRSLTPIIFAPAVSKAYYLKCTVGSSEMFFGVFQAVKYSFNDIEEGISIPLKDPDWGKCVIFFETRETDCEDSKVEVEVDFGHTIGIWNIDLNSGNALNTNEEIDTDTFDQTICTNNGGSYLVSFNSMIIEFKITYTNSPLEDILKIIVPLILLIGPVGTIVGTVLYYYYARKNREYSITAYSPPRSSTPSYYTKKLKTPPKPKRTLKSISISPAGIPFYCQIDETQHSATDKAFQCVKCGRYVCENCRGESILVGRSNCPMCDGDLKPFSSK